MGLMVFTVDGRCFNSVEGGADGHWCLDEDGKEFWVPKEEIQRTQTFYE